MNDSKNTTLSGFWSGEYCYLDVSVSTPFNLFVEDNGGDLSGTTLEPNTFVTSIAPELSATIVGARSGDEVVFRKIYDEGQGTHAYAIFYAGRVNDDFTVIEGEWSFRKAHLPRGGFRLSRASGASEQVSEEVEADVRA